MSLASPHFQPRREAPSYATDVDAGLVAHDPIDIDEVFTDHVGEFGRHQWWLFVVASLAWLSGAFLTYNLTFAGVLLRTLNATTLNFHHPSMPHLSESVTVLRLGLIHWLVTFGI